MLRRFVPLAVLVATAGGLSAQLPPGFDPYSRSISTSLQTYTDPAIQAELKLTDEQKAKIARIPDELLAKHKDAVEKEKASRKQTSDQATAQRAELHKKLDALVEKHLTAEQRTRLGQLVVQQMGVEAFRDADVLKRMPLSAEDQSRLGNARNRGTAQLNKEFPDFGPPFGGPNSEERQKYIEAQRKVTKEVIAEFVKSLSDDRQKAWKELAGEPSDAVSPVGVGTTFSTGPGLFGGGFGAGWPGDRVGALTSLLDSETVLTELKLDKPARDGFTAGLKQLQDEYLVRRGERGPGGMPLQITLRREAALQAADVLTPAQVKRHEQILFQMRGLGVFSSTSYFANPATGVGGVIVSPLPKLTLTPAQVKKIDAVLAAANAKRTKVRGNGWGGFGFIPPGADLTEEQKARAEEARKYRQAITEIETAAVAEITKIFDAGQKAVWKELAGEPFDVAKTSTNSPFGPVGFGGPRSTGRNSIVSQWTREISRHAALGEYAAALAAADEAIRLAPANPSFLQTKANLLATCPSEWVRDGKQAVEIMQKLTADGNATPVQYQTLAAAYAEAGQFDEAVATQQKAIDRLSNRDPRTAGGFTPGAGARSQYEERLKSLYEERLKLYQAKKPFRTAEPPGGGFGPGAP